MVHEEIMQTFRQACEERKVCRVHMKDEPEDRFINPHGVCFSNKDKLIIVCILLKGYSESHNPGNYRNLPFQNCDEVEILERTFIVDPGFNPHSDQYKRWLFHVLKQ
jgi:hypothetical protein